MSLVEVLPGLAAATYQRHSLHGEEMDWVEKNCYSDLWIELLHFLDLEPLALFPFTVSVDFEGDQWTFFKPPPDALRTLYGIDVQELAVWRPLLEHAVEHLGAGKLICAEVDAFWLPDTVGTSYRNEHSKTTILMVGVNVEGRRLTYFHNAGCFELYGDDFCGLFHIGERSDEAAGQLPLFAELVRINRLVRQSKPELAVHSMDLLWQHFERRPPTNPFLRFGKRLEQDLPQLQNRGLAHYHAWAFASTRQAGSAFELAAESLRWLAGIGNPGLTEAADCFDAISVANKALILKGARAVNACRPLDAGSVLLNMAHAWDKGMHSLNSCLAPYRVNRGLASDADG